MIAFGPVPSRRLGRSLGINHIPPKHCTYSCIYCQVGRTNHLETTRRSFFSVDEIFGQVERKIAGSQASGLAIDYLTMIPDGEPTLELHIGELISGLKAFEIPIAVITNASLIDRKEVRDALLLADWVSVKVDAVLEADWRRINRPFQRLSLDSILEGIFKFRDNFPGKLVTETMLVSGVNDSESAADALAEYLLALQPSRAYLSIPTRPPAETGVRPPAPAILQNVLQQMSKKITYVDLLFEAEPADFASTGNLTDDILGIGALHPIREEALRNMVRQAGAGWEVIEELVDAQRLVRIAYRDDTFYMQRF